MTLLDYVTEVCTTMNRTDVDSQNACRVYVNSRYHMVYDAFPWRDSEIISGLIESHPDTSGDDPSAPSAPPQDGGTPTTQFQMPSGMERVIKVGLVSRAGKTRITTDLRPTDIGSLMQTNPDLILSQGVPQFFEELRFDGTDFLGQWIRIYPAAQNPTYGFIVVGKKVCNNLISDSDTPILRNVDNVIKSFALADMLKRDRHYAKADQQLKEAQALLQEAIELEQKQDSLPRASRPLSITGGTLGELTDAVASKLQLWDSEGTIRIQEAVRRCYQELYDRYLWPESILILSMQAQMDILILPSYVERVIKVRCESTADNLDIMELEHLIRIDPGIFEEQGSPVIFNVLPPVAVAVLPETLTPAQLSFISDNNLDTLDIYVYGEAGGVDRREYVHLSAGQGTTFYSYSTPLVISKESPSNGTITVSAGAIKLQEIPPDVSSLQHQRLWVQPINPDTADGNYIILAKRKLQQLTLPVDAVTIRGCESALINMACGEVVPPEKAAPFKAEAEKHIKILTEKEDKQQARRITVTPYTDRGDWGGWDEDFLHHA